MTKNDPYWSLSKLGGRCTVKMKTVIIGGDSHVRLLQRNLSNSSYPGSNREGIDDNYRESGVFVFDMRSLDLVPLLIYCPACILQNGPHRFVRAAIWMHCNMMDVSEAVSQMHSKVAASYHSFV